MAANHNATYQAHSGYSPVPRVPAATQSQTTITYEPLPSGAAGTFRSLEVMAQCVRGEAPPDFSGYRDEYNQRQAIAISGTSEKSERGEIAAIFNFVTHKLKYVPHPLHQQRVQDCRRTIECGSGDCVSKSVCIATLLATRGYLCRFVAQAPNGIDYSHVYCEVQLSDGQWIALDPVAENEPMGWRQAMPDGGFETTQTIFG